MKRALEIVGAVTLACIAVFNIWPVISTLLTPGWLAAADRSEFGTSLLLTYIALTTSLLGWRLYRPAGRGGERLSLADWWRLVIFTAGMAIAIAVGGHWLLALPLVPVVLVLAAIAGRRTRRAAPANIPERAA
jgi:hypothetical protein